MLANGQVTSHESNLVYCAGPLFTPKEREEMAELAEAIERAGWGTFLPQRDGILCEQLSGKIDVELLDEIVFAIDLYNVVHRCSALVVNLNGRVPDEGAIVEAAVAWASGKPVVGYKTDARSLLKGRDNPLITGICNCGIAASVDEVVKLLASLPNQNRHPSEVCKLGEQLWKLLEAGMDTLVGDLFTKFPIFSVAKRRRRRLR